MSILVGAMAAHRAEEPLRKPLAPSLAYNSLATASMERLAVMVWIRVLHTSSGLVTMAAVRPATAPATLERHMVATYASRSSFPSKAHVLEYVVHHTLEVGAYTVSEAR